MALRQALSTLQRSLAPYASSKLAPRAVSRVQGLLTAPGNRDQLPDTRAAPQFLPLCPLPLPQFGSSAASWRSAEAVQDKVPDPETAGWGSTLVGEVMKAKVRTH